MGRLHDLGIKYGTDKATYHGYCDFYELHLRRDPHTVLEIGVKDGASLRMWRDWFPPSTRIIGVDLVLPGFEIPGCELMAVDATDVEAMRSIVKPLYHGFELIIDDGSHMTKDQQICFNFLYDHCLEPKGQYVMEDVHTSSWPEYRNAQFGTDEILRRRFPDLAFYQRNANENDSMTMIIRKP